MDKKYLKELINNFNKSQEIRDNSYFEYFKSLSTLSVGLIGLLVGLKPNPIPNHEAKVAFLATIILIALCILFSLATRFYEVILKKKTADAYKQQLLKYMENPSENTFQADSIDKDNIYKFFEIMTFVCLLLSILALISYVYFLEFKLT